MFEEGHSFCSKKDIPCVPRRTYPVFPAGHILCSKQDIPCVPSKTFRVLQAGKVEPVCSKRKWLKNRENGSDFDDSWTESILSTRTFFFKIFARSKKFSRRRKILATSKQTKERTINKVFCGVTRRRNLIDGYKMNIAI